MRSVSDPTKTDRIFIGKKIVKSSPEGVERKQHVITWARDERPKMEDIPHIVEALEEYIRKLDGVS